jgi:hypothetical protein
VALPPEVLNRHLVVVRYLFESGVQQSQQVGFRGAMSVLTLHDAVEMLLVLGLQHHDVYKRSRNYRFEEYWSELATAGVHVTQQGAMQRLNNARVNLKHHASLPGQDLVEEARTQTRIFFIENTPLIFGSSFDSISLSSLVTSSEFAREHLVSAEHHMATASYDEAMGDIAYAFHWLLGDHELYLREQRWARGGKSALRLDAVFKPTGLGLHRTTASLNPFVRSVSERIADLQQAVRVIGLGLDFAQWQRFINLTPTVIELQPGQLSRTEWHGSSPPTLGECRLCYDFVIDSALRLQKAGPDA